MKKIIALFLAVLYVATTSGVVLNVHYCMGKVSSVKVGNFRNSFCKCGKNEGDGSCCRTEMKIVKLSNDHKATLASFDTKLPVAILAAPVSLIDLREVAPHINVYPDANAPPGKAPKIYIENCVFRI